MRHSAAHDSIYYSTLQHTRDRSRGEVFEVLEFVPTPSNSNTLAFLRGMGRKSKRQGPQGQTPILERLQMIKTKEVTQEFIKEDRASFELIEKKRQSLDCQEIELKKRITMMKALVQKEEEIHKEEEFDLDLSSLEEAQQTPPAQGRRQHGAAEHDHQQHEDPSPQAHPAHPCLHPAA